MAQLNLSKGRTAFKDRNVYYQILRTEKGYIRTTLAKYQFERLRDEGYRTERNTDPCEVTECNWISHSVYITAQPPTEAS